MSAPRDVPPSTDVTADPPPEEDTRTAAPSPRTTRRRFVAIAAAVGALLGLLAFLADGFHGVLGAVAMGIVSSASSWLLVTGVVGFVAPTRRVAALGAAICMGAATTTYYLLRWIVLDPWRMGASDPAAEQWHSPAGLRFLLVAVIWLVGTTVGGAVVGALTHAIPRRRGRPNAVAIGLWLGVCSAPALAYLPDLVSDAVAAWTTQEGAGASVAGATSVLISAISSLILVPVAIPAVARRVGALHPSMSLTATALLSAVVLATVFRLGTDLARAVFAML